MLVTNGLEAESYRPKKQILLMRLAYLAWHCQLLIFIQLCSLEAACLAFKKVTL